MAEAQPISGPGCSSQPTRREFVKTIGTAALAGSVPLVGSRPPVAAPVPAGPSSSTAAETAVARFYAALKDEQRQILCFPSDHPKRYQISNSWAIVRPTIGDLSGEQQALCREIFRNLCSEEGHERFRRQMDDDYGGFKNYHVAVFGEPGTERPFEWVLTGRHATLRADGNRGGNVSLGGPIFYGHAAGGHVDQDPKPSNNVWWYQNRQANAIFSTVEGVQRRRDDLGAVGLPVSTLEDRQKPMVQQLLRDLTRPFRAFEVEEVQKCLRGADGADALRLTFFKEGGSGDARVCTIWKLESPDFAWYFHGTPHVHAWVHVAHRVAQA